MTKRQGPMSNPPAADPRLNDECARASPLGFGDSTFVGHCPPYGGLATGHCPRTLSFTRRLPMLPKRLSVVLAVAAFWLCSATFAQDALVLHLPFDGSLGTPAESRDVALEPGKLGRAVHVKSGDNIRGRLIYDVSKLVDPRKGTLAFWCKTAKDIGPKTAFGRIIHLASEEEGFFYTWLRVSVKGKGDFTFDIYDADAAGEGSRTHGFNYVKGFETWKANEWHHVTFAWHCLKGVRVYDNGQLIYSSWGKEHWDPLTPTVLCLASTPTGPALADLWFDELRLYTEPLEDAHAAALARGEDVRVPKKPEEFAGQVGGSVAKRLVADVGSQPGLMSVTLGKPTTIRQWLVKSAKIRKITCRQLHDGST
ncbi:MAG: LamG domain-containing protein, partial [Planctomycetes bacterium]|nr:LamG domain-containing protein [Planctomycetota bacterium]